MRTLRTDDISKSYRGRKVVDNVSLWVKQGEVVGLLGPNGAGKTTAMQIATGFLLPSSGDGSLMGRRFSDAAARRQLGFVPDAPVFFQGNALSALRFAAALNDLSPSREAMKQVLTDIQTGEYAKSFIIENKAGAPTLQSRRRLTAEHQIETVGAKLRAMMPWIAKNKLVDQSKN